MEPQNPIKSYIPGLPDYVPGEFREGYAKLASNENNYGPSPKVVKALREWAGKTQLYPYRDDELRGRLADYAGAGLENIVIGNGSDELIDMAVKIFKGPVAGSYPSFGEYPIAAGAVGEKYTPVRLQDDFTFDAKEFIKGAGDSRLAFLCSPNNPTGLSIPDEELIQVLESGMTVVLDEAYYEFSGKTRVNWIKDYPNLVIFRTMSKAFALAGVRVGYAVTNPKNVKAFLKVKIPFSVNSLAEAAALAALDDIPYSRKCVKKINADKEKIYKALSKKYKAYPSDSNFIFTDVTPTTAQQFFDQMIKNKIIVRKFGQIKGYKGEYIRISPGTQKETKKLLKVLDKI